MVTFLLGAATGAARHPTSSTRRAAARRRDARPGARRPRGAGQGREPRVAAGKAKGAVREVTPSGPADVDDIDARPQGRDRDLPRARRAKGDVSVDVAAGVVYLRGEVADEQWITRSATRREKVDGVKGVENLLHRPGTPAPRRLSSLRGPPAVPRAAIARDVRRRPSGCGRCRRRTA